MKVEQLDWVSEASVSVCSMKADDLIHETGNHSCCVKLLLIGSVCRRYFLYYEQIFQCVDRVNNRPVSLRTLELHWSVFRSKCCQSHCLGQFRHQTLNKHVKCKPALIMHNIKPSFTWGDTCQPCWWFVFMSGAWWPVMVPSFHKDGRVCVKIKETMKLLSSSTWKARWSRDFRKLESFLKEKTMWL